MCYVMAQKSDEVRKYYFRFAPVAIHAKNKKERKRQLKLLLLLFSFLSF